MLRPRKRKKDVKWCAQCGLGTGVANSSSCKGCNGSDFFSCPPICGGCPHGSAIGDCDVNDCAGTQWQCDECLKKEQAWEHQAWAQEQVQVQLKEDRSKPQEDDSPHGFQRQQQSISIQLLEENGEKRTQNEEEQSIPRRKGEERADAETPQAQRQSGVELQRVRERRAKLEGQDRATEHQAVAARHEVAPRAASAGPHCRLALIFFEKHLRELQTDDAAAYLHLSTGGSAAPQGTPPGALCRCCRFSFGS